MPNIDLDIIYLYPIEFAKYQQIKKTDRRMNEIPLIIEIIL